MLDQRFPPPTILERQGSLMLHAWLIVAVVACKGADSKPASRQRSSAAAVAHQPAPSPPDEMDEKMRHCPLALYGAVTTLDDIDGGVRFAVKVPEASLSDARRRAHHIVDFAAKKTRAGHGEFDGKGGGHMKNCPVVTDGVTITVADVDSGARLDVTTDPEHVGELRTESRERARKFSFAGATIHIAGSR